MGCTKENKKEAVLKANEYELVAEDLKSIRITLPETFFCSEGNKKVATLKAYYQKNSTKPLSLHYFKESEDYSWRDIETRMEGYVKEYEDLVMANKGELLHKTALTDLETGTMKGKYVEVLYALDGSTSYFAGFYLQDDGYVMQGTVRLDGKDREQVKIKALVNELLQNK